MSRQVLIEKVNELYGEFVGEEDEYQEALKEANIGEVSFAEDNAAKIVNFLFKLFPFSDHKPIAFPKQHFLLFH